MECLWEVGENKERAGLASPGQWRSFSSVTIEGPDPTDAIQKRQPSECGRKVALGYLRIVSRDGTRSGVERSASIAQIHDGNEMLISKGWCRMRQ